MLEQILNIAILVIRFLIFVPLIWFITWQWPMRKINGDAIIIRRIVLKFVISIALLIGNLLYSRIWLFLGQPEIALNLTTSFIFLITNSIVLFTVWQAVIEIRKLNKNQ